MQIGVIGAGSTEYRAEEETRIRRYIAVLTTKGD
jgi:hypothetical protein